MRWLRCLFREGGKRALRMWGTEGRGDEIEDGGKFDKVIISNKRDEKGEREGERKKRSQK